MEIVRDEQEINDVLNACSDQAEEGGSRWPGMSYEQGVAAAIDWITRLESPNPLYD